MSRIALALLLPAALGAQPRVARVSEMQGQAEIQLAAARDWLDAQRHLPVLAGSRLRSGASSQLEIELDESSVFRLAAGSEAELSDYTRLSTGQLITHHSLDRGVAYFSGEPGRRDALALSLPGVQASLLRGSRVRLEAETLFSRVSVMEGEIRVYSPHFEINLREGAAVRVAGSRSDRFSIEREVAELDSDGWSRERDKLLPLRQGRGDLDAHGVWIDTAEFGAVWKPKTAEGWAPFREGRWLWFDALGYTWIPNELWGWLPYHAGRWLSQPSLGWIWVPGKSGFDPGAVYWLAGKNFLGWGPLAPGESWTAEGVPERYFAAHTTFAALAPEAAEINPARFALPVKDPLAAGRFILHPQALRPAWIARQAGRDGVIRLNPELPPSPRQPAIETRAPAPPPAKPAAARAAVPPAGTPLVASAPAVPAIPPAPPNPIYETYYVAPIYTGIIILNPPERDAEEDKHKEEDKPWKPGESPRRRPRRPTDPSLARGEDPSRRSR